MKKSVLIALGLGSLALVWLVVRKQENSRDRSAAIAKVCVRPAKTCASKAPVLPVHAEAPAPPVPAAAPAAPSAAEKKPMTPEEFAVLIDKTDMRNFLAIDATTQQLRAEDPKMIAKYFYDLFHRLGPSKNDDRAQLVSLANSLQSDELLPLWKDLAHREPPLVTNESAVLSSPEPSLAAKEIHGEMAMAIRNLGIIAFHRPDAVDILANLVTEPNKNYSMVFERANAYIALKEADPSSAIRALKQLPPDDTLRVFLKNAR